MLHLALKGVSLMIISTMQLLYSIILGIVQGVSEWLPISSKTQIIIVSTYLLKLNFNAAYAFGLFMEIGTISASIIYFRKEIFSLIKVLIGKGNKESMFLFKYVLVSTIVTALIAAPLYLYVDSIQGHYNIGIPMIIIGVVLLADAVIIKYARAKHKRATNTATLSSLSFKDYILVGIAQGVAALPGVSRSGITTSTLLLLNVDAAEAFRLSFIDMIFATSGAVALTWIASKSSIISTIHIIGAYGLIISIIVATIVSLLLIRFLLNIAKKSSIIYLVLALGIIALSGGIIAIIYGVA